jgi:IclR family acetate operon transcriptional repressor
VAGTLKSVDQALAVMEHLASATEPLTLTALSQHFNLSKATMHRILVTLRDRGYVVRDPITARYGFGLTATRLVQQAGVAESLTEACWPAMRWLWNRTEETVLLAVRDGDQSVIVEKLDSNRPVLATYSLGRLMPLHAVSTGLALLAHHPDSEIREILNSSPLSRYTTHSATTVDAVWRDVRSTRAKGYSINREQFRDGVSGVAAAVRGRDPRRPAAAIAVCVPSSRFEPHVDALCEAVVAAADRASEAFMTGRTSMHADDTHPPVDPSEAPVPLTGRTGRKSTAKPHPTPEGDDCVNG